MFNIQIWWALKMYLIAAFVLSRYIIKCHDTWVFYENILQKVANE